jgi:hypothetical protein
LQLCDEAPENVYVFGNRDYIGIRDDEIEKIREALESIADDLYNLEAQAHEESELCGIVRDHFPGRVIGGGYGVHDCAHIAKNALELCDYPRDRREECEVIADALALIYGEPFELCTLRGCCQGEWQYCIYPAAYGYTYRHALETEYFNTGTEWIIHDEEEAPEEPEDINGYSIYCYSYDPRAEIAANHGVQPEEVQLYTFAGYTRRASWEVA